ncbi:unnamed protein product [Ixodes hexagonus]
MPPRKSRRLDMSSAATEQTQTLEEYAARINQLCPEMSDPEAILYSLENTHSVLTSRKMDHSIGCTHSDTQACHILRHLKLWNEFLWIVHLELKEVLPRKLGIVHQLGCDWRVASDIQRSHASILLHWLLKKHHCIESLELKQTPFATDLHLISDGLRCNVGIKSIKVSLFEEVPKSFVTALATLPKLEELELRDSSLTRHALAELPLTIKKMPSLRTLKLDMRKLNPRSISGLIDALEHSTVAVLHIPGWCLNNGTVFADLLARNTKLKELTISCIIDERERTNEVLALFGAMKLNRSLEKLHLPYCSLQLSECSFLAEVMAENSSLRVLEVQTVYGHEPYAFAELIERNSSLRELEVTGLYPRPELAGSIRRNTTLKKLSFHCARMTMEITEAFLAAVADNQSLELVTLGNVFEMCPGEFHELLEQKGLEKRVRYNCYTSEPPIHMSNKNSGRKLERVFAGPERDPEMDVILYMYSKLASPYRLVEVSIRLERLDHAAARLLARFLSTTKVLESLYLAFYTDESSMPALLEGLSLNKTIVSLAFEDCEFTTEDAKLLAAVVEKSRTLQEIVLLSPEYSTSLAVMSELSWCLDENYFLLSVRTNEYLDLGHYMFEIKDIMRRNGSMLLDAVQFAMGSCTKRHAEAFERHLENKALVRKIQEIAKETEFEASERIKTRLRYLKYNFMTVAGIVKESVVCEQGRKQQTLLDQIGYDNLLRVVSYLKLRDIVDEPVAGCSRASRSRMQLRRRRARS